MAIGFKAHHTNLSLRDDQEVGSSPSRSCDSPAPKVAFWHSVHIDQYPRNTKGPAAKKAFYSFIVSEKKCARQFTRLLWPYLLCDHAKGLECWRPKKVRRWKKHRFFFISMSMNRKGMRMFTVQWRDMWFDEWYKNLHKPLFECLSPPPTSDCEEKCQCVDLWISTSQ